MDETVALPAPEVGHAAAEQPQAEQLPEKPEQHLDHALAEPPRGSQEELEHHQEQHQESRQASRTQVGEDTD